MPPKRLSGAGAGEKSGGPGDFMKNRIWVDGFGKVARGPCGASRVRGRGCTITGKRLTFTAGIRARIAFCRLRLRMRWSCILRVVEIRIEATGVNFVLFIAPEPNFLSMSRSGTAPRLPRLLSTAGPNTLCLRETKRRDEARFSRNVFECEDCKQVFKTRGSLQRHRNGDREQVAACRFLLHEDNVCKKCGRAFQFKRFHQLHMRSMDCSLVIEPDSIPAADDDIEIMHH